MLNVFLSALKEAAIFGLIYVVYLELSDEEEKRRIKPLNIAKYVLGYVFMSCLLYMGDVTSGKPFANTTSAILATWMLTMIKPNP
jgi:hypothetical protein